MISFWKMIWEPLEKVLDVKIALDMDALQIFGCKDILQKNIPP
jgi:hypothetical protein